MEKEVINEICKFIIDKCKVMNAGNFEILSDMIVNDVQSIQSKLHKHKNDVCNCSKFHDRNEILYNECISCGYVLYKNNEDYVGR